MKKKAIRILALVLAVLILGGTIIGALVNAESASWEKDVYAYGSGLSNTQIESTAKFLGVSKKTPRMIIKGKDAEKYINEPSTNASMISSVYISKNNSKDIKVEVVTPLTIQSVSSLQYSNAAITAGVKGLDIKVGAVVPVSGTSALTGVYKALESLGVNLDTKRTELANEEISKINEISDNNKNNPKFSKDKLNKAIVEGKEKILEIKQNDGNINAEKIEKVIQNVIKDNNLNNVVNNIDIKNLNIIFNNFAKIANDKNFDLNTVKTQLKNLAGSIQELAKKELTKAQEFLKTDEGKSFLESIKGKLNSTDINALLDKGKESLSSENIEKLLNSVKDNISSEKLNELVNSAKENLGITPEKVNEVKSKATGFLGKIFETIKNFFRSLFN